MIKIQFILLIIIIWQVQPVSGQVSNSDVLHLTEAYNLLHENWPVSNKEVFQRKITDLNRRIAGSGWLPEFQVHARMSYQSDVTQVPFSAPGVEQPVFSKDQYNISLHAYQTVFDGGRARAIQQAENFAGDAELARIEVEMHAVKNRMEQVWYGILLLQKEHESIELMREDLLEQLAQVQSKVEHGVLLPGNELVMKAELIRIEQELARIDGRIQAGYAVLSELLGVDVVPETELKTTVTSSFQVEKGTIFMRPEYELFDAGLRILDSQKSFAASEMMPVVSLFATSAYGRPGLNVFDDDLQFYWILGVRAQWSFRNTRNAKLKSEIISLQKNSIETDRETFTRNLSASLRSLENEIESFRLMIEQDDEVLRLRKLVTEEKKHLLIQGVITSTEYITELNAETRTRLNLEARKIRLTQLITEYETIRGNR